MCHKIGIRRTLSLCLLPVVLMFHGCENFNTVLATSAAIEAVQAFTLSDEQIRELSARAAQEQDKKNKIATADNVYAKRLAKLVGKHSNEGGVALDYRVYLSNAVNAFAMADGTIRVYSGLMDIMSDEELLFVIGHEIGHVVEGHSRKAAQVAYSASAARKGAAALGGTIGAVAQSEIGALSEKIISAQFSQSEEKEADDYGLNFMRQNGYDVQKAISSLLKLGSGGGGLLASHPDSHARAERLRGKL